MRSKSIRLLGIALVLGLTAESALANGAVDAGAMSRLDRAEREAEITAPPAGSDGFIEARNFYREGPAFRICPEQEGKRIAPKDGQCTVVTRVKDGFFSLPGYHYEYEPIGPGIDPQSYLDQKFGKGTTQFTGVSGRNRNYHDYLIIFYQITEVSG